ncbi:MAG: formylglycine-generating enzyme family protein [Kiritimatiellae bacterium]|nr:formylglycine-generating enzyme family protein [Kiritimatiellia bacterium]
MFNMKKSLLLSVTLGWCTLFAAPQISDVTLIPQSGTRRVTVKYKLSVEPAVITVDFTTNGVSIGSENIISITGDVSRRIEPSDNLRTIHWNPDKDWPNHLITDGSFKAVVTAWATNAPPDYMAIDLATKSNIFYYVSADAVPGGVTNPMYKTSMLLMRKVPAGGKMFRMGSSSSETGRTAANENLHWVMLSEDYYLGVFEATQGQWHQFKSTKGFQYKGNEARPAESFGVTELRGSRADGYSWPLNGHDVKSDGLFGLIRGRTGVQVDLPTEAQWEFACRAGTESAYSYDTNKVALADFAWFGKASGSGTHEVGLLRSNGLGFYDMHGNVSETCLDYFQAALTGPVEDPEGVDSGNADNLHFTVRGGHVEAAASGVRSASRQDYNNPNGYFRLWGFRFWAPAVAP